MTIAESFIAYLESQDIATFGQDLFLRRVPDSSTTGASVYWVIPNGGFPLGRNQTGEMIKQYSFLIYYRSNKAQLVEQKLFELEETLNMPNSVQLEGFEVIETEVNQFATDEDEDLEGREVGLIQVNIKTYKQGR